MDAVKLLCDVRRTMQELIEKGTQAHGDEFYGPLLEQVEKLDKLIVPASLTMEALNPVFDLEGGSRGYLKLLDLCYNAFMIGRNLENREDGGRCDWFNDTHSLMVAGVERIQKECVQRMEYAKKHDPVR